MSLTKASYSMISGAPVNVVDFGADATGTADSTTAINNAILYAQSNNLNSVVFAPGKYKISSPINVKGNFNGGIVLDGNDCVITQTANTKIFDLDSTSPSSAPELKMNLLLKDFVLVGNSISNSSAIGINMYGAGFQISNCNISNCYYGIYGAGCLINDFNQLWINNNYCGLYFTSANAFAPNSLNFYSCHIYANTLAIVHQNFPNSAAVYVGCEIEGNNLNGNTTDGVKVINFTNAGKVSLIGCHIEDNPGQYNIYYSSSAYCLSVIGCEIIPGDSCGTVLEVSNSSGTAELYVEGSRVTNNVGTAQINVDSTCSALIVGSTSGYVAGTNVTRVFGGNYAANSIWQVKIGGPGSNTYLQLNRTGTYALEAGSDNAQALGSGGIRWSTVYAATGTINTSDANQKQQFAALTTAEQNTAKAIKGLFKTFKFNDAVAKKGANARTHVGVSAQDVQAAFTANGLDATKYGLFCSDTWYTLNGAVVPAGTAGATEVTQLGVRYEELLAFVIAAM